MTSRTKHLSGTSELSIIITGFE